MPFHGNQHSESFQEWSHQRLVDSAEELALELNRSPTTEEAVEDDRFPCLATIYKYADGGWLSVLEDADLERTQVRGYGSDERPRMCRDLYGAYLLVDSPSLTHRQYDTVGRYPTSVVKEHFGSWRAACDAAGIPSGQKHGEQCEGPQGERLESRLEQATAEIFFERDVEYVPHPEIEGTAWIADFYLPAYVLWVEVDGYGAGTRPNKRGFARKLRHLEETTEDFLIVESTDDVVEALQDRDASISS